MRDENRIFLIFFTKWINLLVVFVGTTSRLSKISNVADDSISIQLLKTLLAETFEIKFVKEKGNVLNSLIMEVGWGDFKIFPTLRRILDCRD